MNLEEGKEIVVIQPTQVKLLDGRLESKTHTWKGEIISISTNKQTLIVKDIDRGKGWCPLTKKYKGVINDGGWYRGQNHGYGDKIEVPIEYIHESNTIS